MKAKPFDLADWQRRLKAASGADLLVLTEEILTRDEDREYLSESPPTQEKPAEQEPDADWPGRYTTRRMRDVAVKALELSPGRSPSPNRLQKDADSS